MLKTPLHAWHTSNGARMIDFGGWDMPVTYSSINAEHQATRQSAGLFDICHMGRLVFQGPQAVAFLDHMLTNRVDTLNLGQARYALVLNEQAGIRDDVLVYRMQDYHLLVVNASNREKLLDWFTRHLDAFDCQMTDRTKDWAMVAVQGPQAISVVQTFFDFDLSAIKYYYATETQYENSYAIVSRTGYTGEDGVELIVAADKIVDLCRLLKDRGVTPVGLGARDTLRLEAGMPLYGHELTEEIDPIQARLGWAVKASEKDFVGKPSLVEKTEPRTVRVGLKLNGKRIAREGFPILHEGRPVGHVTSGTFSPTLGISIAMGYVQPELSAVGTELAIEIRNAHEPASVVDLPFYKRKKT